MERRDFLKVGTVFVLCLTFDTKNLLFAESNIYPDLAVAKGYPPAKLVESAIGALGGIRRFVSRGDVVVVKPNIAWDRTPEMAANTNPEVVAEIVRLCYEAGAKQVKVLDRSVNDPKRCYVQSGIERHALSQGAKIVYPDDRKFRKVEIKGEILKSWELWTEVLEADKIINVPIAKHHSLARLTMGLKNMMGIMGGFRGLIHQRLDDSLADLVAFVRPTLTVLDAIRILVRGGPQGGDLKDVVQTNTVIVGTDPVAVDAYGSTLFGLRPEDIGAVKKAAERGIGRMDIEKMRIKRLSVQ
ncbi:MAG: DUF362 domain-containing protein [Desulfobacterota bacterium]|nr:DUF362 domain-containing protein [Thermodesulfobacteriota bacterium]MDW8001297.1 DUF362 domain-containing protein [Deltaproteobacteria bacterium]